MFGYLRFTLAFLVLLSHIDIRFFGLNQGVIAVVIFYILAGFVLSHLYRNIFSPSLPTKQALLSLYKDRFLRIFPLYISAMFATLLFLQITSFASPDYSFLKLLNNLTIIPLNYYMYIDSTILTTPSWCLIPPAWSLGTELQAYLLLPFAIIYKRAAFIFILISFAIFLTANLSIINPDYYGYRFLVGVFFIFFTGIALERRNKIDKFYIILIWVTISILTIIFSIKNSFSPTYTRESFIGLLIGIPLIWHISKTDITLPLNKYLGNLSYAIFLTHFLSIWILQHIGIPQDKTFTYILQLTTLTILISSLLLKLTPPPR